MTKILNIKVIPNSQKNEIAGEMADGTLKIKIKSAPEKGKANKELISFLSDFYDVPKNKIEIIKGKTGRKKIVKVL